jgi:nucleotidyltransferase substrate binding protein (TIGR01987 family)
MERIKMSVLDLDSLEKAVASLQNSWDVLNSKETKNMTANAKEIIKAGVVQNFEVTYELCWKFIQRWINLNRTEQEVDQARTKKDIYRLAAKYSLIKDPLAWFEYGDARNLSAHTYNSNNVKAVLDKMPAFIDDSKYLLKRLEQTND